MNGRKIKIVRGANIDYTTPSTKSKKMDRLHSKWIFNSLWNLDKIQPKFKVRVIHPLDKKEQAG